MRRRPEHPDETPCEEAVLLREDELARRWRISLRTLQRWRAQGLGPAHLVIGRRILYRRAEVEDYERRRLRKGGGT